MTATETTVSTRDQLLYDLFVTALEGGIGYWATCSTYHNAVPSSDRHGQRARSDDDVFGFHAVIHEMDDESAHVSEWPVHRVDRAVLAKGYRLATSKEWRNRLAWSSGEKPPFIVTADTDWDFDAGDADMVVQLGLFGDVVYG
jgi:hypothetical protein